MSSNEQSVITPPLTEYQMSMDTPTKNTGVPARQPQTVGAAAGSGRCNDINKSDDEIPPTSHMSDADLEDMANSVKKRGLTAVFQGGVTMYANVTHKEDNKKPQARRLAGFALPTVYDHGPGGDGGPEVFTPRKKVAIDRQKTLGDGKENAKE